MFVRVGLCAGVLLSCRQVTPDSARESPSDVGKNPAIVALPEVQSKQAHGVSPKEALMVIGLENPPKITAKAREINQSGLVHHGSGRFQQAAKAFAEALALSPDHDLARYNLACALSQLGDFTNAVKELRQVIVRDPARFVSRINADPDLEPLRQSALFPALGDHITQAKQAWVAAFERGVGALHYSYTSPAVVNHVQEGGTKELVAGLYLHEEQRFLPFAYGGDFAYVDMANRRVVQLDSKLWEGAVHSIWRRTKIRVSSAAPDEPIQIHVDLDEQAPSALKAEPQTGIGFVTSFAVVSVAAGLELKLDWDGSQWTKRTRLQATSQGLAWPGEQALPMTAPRMDVVVEGAVLWDPPAAGHVLKASKYSPPGSAAPIDLGTGHRWPRWQSLAVSPDGLYVVITAIEHREGNREKFEATGRGITRHSVSRVELGSLRVAILAQGRGTARAVFGPDGALYVQSGNRLMRWAKVAEATEGTGAPTMQGVLLVTPLEPMECMLCG